MSTILFTDDNTHFTDLMSRMISRIGHESLIANSGKECLDLLDRHRPDLIMLDILMPGLDGWETLAAIRKNPRTGSIPVVMVTAKQITCDEARTYTPCIDGYVMKPILLDTLREIIGEVHRRKVIINSNAGKAAVSGLEPELIDEYCRCAHQFAVSRKIAPLIPDPGDYSVIVSRSEIQYHHLLKTLRERGIEPLPLE